MQRLKIKLNTTYYISVLRVVPLSVRLPEHLIEFLIFKYNTPGTVIMQNKSNRIELIDSLSLKERWTGLLRLSYKHPFNF